MFPAPTITVQAPYLLKNKTEEKLQRRYPKAVIETLGLRKPGSKENVYRYIDLGYGTVHMIPSKWLARKMVRITGTGRKTRKEPEKTRKEPTLELEMPGVTHRQKNR